MYGRISAYQGQETRSATRRVADVRNAVAYEPASIVLYAREGLSSMILIQKFINKVFQFYNENPVFFGVAVSVPDRRR